MALNDPSNWQGSHGESPPHNYQQVAADGRYWWIAPIGQPVGSDGDITYIGPSPSPVSIDIHWEIVVPCEDATIATIGVNGIDSVIGSVVSSGVLQVRDIDPSGLTVSMVQLEVPPPYPTYNGVVAMTFIEVLPVIGGQGDITNPGAWEDSSGNIPPRSYTNPLQ